jgi:hypothetical protein
MGEPPPGPVAARMGPGGDRRDAGPVDIQHWLDTLLEVGEEHWRRAERVLRGGTGPTIVASRFLAVARSLVPAPLP